MRSTRIKTMAAMETGNPSAAWEAIQELSEFCDLSAAKLLKEVKEVYGTDLQEQDYGYPPRPWGGDCSPDGFTTVTYP